MNDAVWILFGETSETEDEPDLMVFASCDSAERYACDHYDDWNVEEYEVQP